MRDTRPLVRALTGYMALLTLLVTFAPLEVRFPGHFELSWVVDPVDIVGNVLFFVPLGFLLGLSIRRPVVSVLIAAGLSMTVEIGQIWVPLRHTSLVDLCTNTAGAGVGLALQRVVSHRLWQRLEGSLALELPLMSLVYMLVPLLWLVGLGALADPRRLVLYPVLAVIGAVVIASVHRNRLADAGLSADRVAWLGTAWLLLGAAPGFRTRPLFVLSAALVTGAITLGLCLGPWLPRSDGKRFELPTLKWVWPLFAVYLVALVHWPIRLQFEPFYGELSLTEGHIEYYRYLVLEILEYTAAFTLCGYMLAETGGRRGGSALRAVLEITAAIFVFAAAMELLRGFSPNHARLLRPPLAALAGLGGAVIYRQQLATMLGWRHEGDQP